MQLTKTHKIIITVITAIVLTVIYIMIDRNNNVSLDMAKDNQVGTTTKNIPGTNVSIEGNQGDYTVTQVPVETKKNIPIPDLNRAVVFAPSVSLSDEAKKILIEKVQYLQGVLKKDNKDIGSWNNLGIYQKMAGDYGGAVESWKYASEISDDFVSLGNLGNIYGYYLKNNNLSESYYKKAISRSPKTAYLYIQLSSVYKLFFNDIKKAKDILDQGLVLIPNDPSITEAKNNL